MKEGTPFDLAPGDRLATKFEVLEQLGAGVEGEVYLVKENLTGARRAAKLFYPEHDARGRRAKSFAKKLHRLANCPSVVRYVGHEETFLAGRMVTVLVSEFVDGAQVAELVRAQPQKRFEPFAALHLMRAVTVAVQEIHAAGEVHGDIHDENILARRVGLGFAVKLLDPWLAGRRSRALVEEDVVMLARLLPELVGGDRGYARLPAPYRDVLGSMRRDRILSRFRTIADVRQALDSIDW